MEEKYMEHDAPRDFRSGEDEIDLIALAKKLWDERMLIIKCCCAAVVVALVIGFSIPREYTTTVILSPEMKDARTNANIGALAGFMGINLGNSSRDAVYPELYPDVVSSVPFITDLFDLQVVDKDGELRTTLYDYMAEHTRGAWWSAVLAAPFRALGWFISLFRGDDDAEGEDAGSTVDTFRLSSDQWAIVQAINNRINVAVDKKNYVVTLSVTMQDPVVSAMVTDAVVSNLQNHITEYRTSKSRNDLEFVQMLYNQSRRDYEKAHTEYANYVDSHQNMVLQSVRIEQERLQQAMTMAFNVYNQTAQQLQLAKTKVQESTPAYAIVQPATVPLRASKPSKMMILIGCVFLAGVGASAWILFGRDILAKFRKEGGDNAN